MKKLYIIITISGLLASLRASAQLSKGNWLAGGMVNIGYSSNSISDASQHYKATGVSLQLMPSAGYFIISRLCAGIAPGYYYANSNSNSTDYFSSDTLYRTGKSHSSGFIIAPFARYYFLPEKSKLNVFALAQYEYTRNKSHNFEETSQNSGPPSAYEATGKFNYHNWTLGAGPVWFITPNIGAEFTILYTLAQNNDPFNQHNSWSAGAGLQIYLGK